MGAWSLEAASAFVSVFPGPLQDVLARLFGLFYGRFATTQRKAQEENIRQLLNPSPSEINRIVDETFQNFALTLRDFFLPEGVSIEIPDRDKLEQWRKDHGGVLLLTFHMGHWELGARTMSDWGWPVTAVYQPYQNKQFKRVIEKRRAKGVNFIPVGRNAARGVRDALRRGDVVAMLGDHPFGEDGMAVTILGHRVIWPKGPLVLAVRSKTPVVVAVVVRTANRRYRAYIEDPLIPKGDGRQAVNHLVQAVADKFGRFVRQNPTQWYRFRPLEIVK